MSETRTVELKDNTTYGRLFWPVAIALPILGAVIVAAFQAGRISEVKDLTAVYNYYVQTSNDFGGLRRYQVENTRLTSRGAAKVDVVFFGDSITDFWSLRACFPRKRYVNRGIAGQTTEQMLVRFKQDVLDLHPAVVLILGGGNDMQGRTGPESVEQIEANIQTLAEMAHFHGIHVVIESMLPVSKMIWTPREKAKIVKLNAWLKEYATQNGYPYVDYYNALQDGHDNLVDRFHRGDGMHPSADGYAVMTPLAEKAIKQSEADNE
jgi:acyl-CoA thioesterase I